MDAKSEETLSVTVEFTGGLEILFSNQRKQPVSLPVLDENGVPPNMAYLVRYLCTHLMRDPRKELFVVDDAVMSRPGILVLINDADWELEGETEYVLQKDDNILFVSTLHGG
ncbi:MAG: hypothetical protein Q9166_001379 [cf. Caloplaca sp. 2 TL-2023]